MRVERRRQRWRGADRLRCLELSAAIFAKPPSQIIDCGGTPQSKPRGADVIAKPAVSFRWRSLQSMHSMALGSKPFEATVGVRRESKQGSRACAVSTRCPVNDCTRSHPSEG